MTAPSHYLRQYQPQSFSPYGAISPQRVDQLSFTLWWRHQMETFFALLAFVRGIHRWPMDSPHKGKWRVAFTFSLISAWTNPSANNRDAGVLRRHCAWYDVTVMWWIFLCHYWVQLFSQNMKNMSFFNQFPLSYMHRHGKQEPVFLT